MVTVDPALRDELARSTSGLQQLADRFTGLPEGRFINPSARQVMPSNIKALAGWFAQVQKTFPQRTGPPLRQQTLLGMRDEALALNSFLTAILSARENVTSGDQEQVNAIYKDIQVQIEKYDNVMAGEPPVSDHQYKVIVTAESMWSWGTSAARTC